MDQLPIYVNAAFVLITMLMLMLFFKASNYSRPVILLISVWLTLQLIISLSGFYTVTDVMPPRFLLLVLPPFFLIAGMFNTLKGRIFIDSLSLETLTMLHIVRIPVELILFMLYIHKYIPEEMTFEGRNFDIISGLTAPIVYFGMTKNLLSRKVLLTWNIICLILLINIVFTAILSAPFPFQQFGFKQPNIAVFHFPFVWLPGFIVPIVLFSHLVAVRKLLRKL